MRKRDMSDKALAASADKCGNCYGKNSLSVCRRISAQKPCPDALVARRMAAESPKVKLAMEMFAAMGYKVVDVTPKADKADSEFLSRVVDSPPATHNAADEVDHDKCLECIGQHHPKTCAAIMSKGVCPGERGPNNAAADYMSTNAKIAKPKYAAVRTTFICSVQLSGMRLVNPLNTRQHWRIVWARSKQQRTAAQRAICAMLDAAYRDMRVKRIVTITRVGPAEMDTDNLAASAKPVRDGVADAFGVNDKSPLWVWKYEQKKCKRGSWGVEITVEEESNG